MKKFIEIWFNSIFNFAKLLTIFYKKIEFGAVQKDVNLVDLENSKMLQNEYLFAKFGFDTAENEPLKVWGLIQFNIQSSP